MSKGSIITLVVLVVAVFASLLIYKDRRAAATRVEARQAALEFLGQRPKLVEHEVYLAELVDRFHDQAFEVAYVHGGFFQASEYDEQVYFEELWPKMRKAARDDGRSDVAVLLPGAGDEEKPGWLTPKHRQGR